jgi:hypothetical protein
MLDRLKNLFRSRASEEILDAMFRTFDDQVEAFTACANDVSDQAKALESRAVTLRSKADRARMAAEKLGSLVSF